MRHTLCNRMCHAPGCLRSLPQPAAVSPASPPATGDGDRRNYAKQQWADFVARGGVPERKAAAVAANLPSSEAAINAAAGSD